MSSSSSSGSSDEDAASASSAAAPSAQALAQAVELAQICSFCTTFRAPLRLPSFSRTELQEALLGASNGDRTHVELLAELHFKLAREHPTAKMDKMVQDWEKTLARKLQENWRKEFTANPMGGGVSYRDLTVFERVKILDALCHWKLDTCGEIHKHIAMLQKENDNDAIKKLRAGEIGTDDKGVSYWYFDDGCWIYAEEKPRWQLEEREPSYAVEFASAKRIRLSINFDPDHNSLAPPTHLPKKTVAFSDDVKESKDVQKDGTCETVAGDKGDDHSSSKSKVKNEVGSPQAVRSETEHKSSDLVKRETQERALPKAPSAAFVDTPVAVKEEAPSPTARRMDINLLCAAESPSSEEGDRKRGGHPTVVSQEQNGQTEKQSSEHSGTTGTKEAASDVSMPPAVQVGQESNANLGVNEKANKDASGEHIHATVVAVVGSKKRTIIDDDSSDSSSDADVFKAKGERNLEPQTASSPPPRKKRKPSIENTKEPVTVDAEPSKIDVAKLNSVEANGVSVQASKDDPVTTITKGSSSLAVQQEATSAKGANPLSTAKDELPMTPKTDVAVGKIDEATNPANASGPASTSPTDPAAAPELFDITCESCKKCYDMRYLDPPLVERPTDEWRCFECLVNDARGWPRRRKRIPREPFSPRAEGESLSKKRSSSSKSRSGSSSSKKSKKSSSRNHSSSSSKKKSSRSSSSKKSSSSSKKHKKHKSSSSSHHRSRSHGHHRRRHHSHYHHEEFAKLASLFRERQEQRLGIEDARIKGDLEMAFDDAPQGWRVASSTLEGLRALIEALSGGSLEQDRLRGRLILILKKQEKLEEQRRKQQELAWNILPRRQSSRIAIGRMKHQSAQESDAEDGYSDDEAESRRPGLRSRRSTSNGLEDNTKHDRAWRARRRHLLSDDDMDQEDEVDSNGVPLPSAGGWIDWSLLKGNPRCLSTVCLALVDRLLKEEAAELFSRPVDPELDGCPNYLSVINHPMDLGTIRSRVEANFYRRWKIFKKDVDLVWHNCRTFNAPNTMVVQFADVLANLARAMCIAAEKKGVSQMKDDGSGGEESAHDSDDSSSDDSKAESRSSVNKAWAESSASESSDSSEGDSSSDGASDSDELGSQRRSTRRSSTKSPTRSRSTRSGRTGRSAETRRSTRSRSSKKRPAPSSGEDESSSSSDDEVLSPVRKPRRQVRGSASKADGMVDPPTEDEASSDDDTADNQPPPPGSRAPSPCPPPPPPPQAVQKRPKPRLVISDSSSSDSSDSDSNSSSSSSDSDSDSDAAPAASKRPQPPPPSSADVPAPPPPTPPPPAASPVDRKPRVQAPPKTSSSKKKTPSSARKAKAARTGSSGYTHSPSLLNSYLSPSSSSSSDYSGDSESSDGDSDESD